MDRFRAPLVRAGKVEELRCDITVGDVVTGARGRRPTNGRRTVIWCRNFYKRMLIGIDTCPMEDSAG
jgi:hypothetical protein